MPTSGGMNNETSADVGFSVNAGEGCGPLAFSITCCSCAQLSDSHNPVLILPLSSTNKGFAAEGFEGCNFKCVYQTIPAMATDTPRSFLGGISSPKNRHPPVRMITVFKCPTTL
eukprot:GHUV01028074.1.p2 GENE.GHUV01028074.1~~GHUV01028074.1.p2  ORF type:complete len:114 (-),score=9.88 GHUV01028074.1:342-683(-)